ncbi:MAG: ATP-dependent Clp protease ATP-binding subunit ClpX [Candidatus Shikimatogenerans sp. AspAUS03]|uniref:ATP-dependent Clp protease ATP-binding subunit ClpX n=1 Tax=Candidatus Shikimatogenerans sp. AspAUS03 TaxID=3158563 RepID=A0AAU7QSV1_9FLAO
MLKCSFCSRYRYEVYLFIHRINIYICNICIKKFHKILQNNNMFKSRMYFIFNKMRNLTPIGIKKHLDKYLVGQYQAKKTLSVSVYIHYKRIINNFFLLNNINVEKSNIILIGPTGSGKTYLLKTISKLLNVPFVIVNSTSFTESGYVGEDVENILYKLFQKANYSISLTEIGIVFIDEIDKICKKNNRDYISKDISGEGVQQALLKLLEDSIIDIPVVNTKGFIRRETIRIRTKNILFIVGGAFVNLSNNIYNRKNKSTIGYKYSVNNRFDREDMYKYITHKDLINYGFIPEFIGRLPIIAYTNKLKLKDFYNIIFKVKNSILIQFKKIFELENKIFYISKNSIKVIVRHCLSLQIGARGLKNIFGRVFRDIIYNINKINNNIFINKKFIINLLKYE